MQLQLISSVLYSSCSILKTCWIKKLTKGKRNQIVISVKASMRGRVIKYLIKMLLELFICKIDAQLLEASRRKGHQKLRNDKNQRNRRLSTVLTIELKHKCEIATTVGLEMHYTICSFQHTLFFFFISRFFLRVCVLTFIGMLQFLTKKIQPKCMNQRNAGVSRHIAILSTKMLLYHIGTLDSEHAYYIFLSISLQHQKR